MSLCLKIGAEYFLAIKSRLNKNSSMSLRCSIEKFDKKKILNFFCGRFTQFQKNEKFFENNFFRKFIFHFLKLA
jgi:hypothetical protein